MHTVETVLALLAFVTLLSYAAGMLKIAYPTVMVLGGLGIAFVPHLPRIQLDPHMVFVLFLPPLLYAGAWQTSWRDFKANARPIFLLAVGFVIFTTVVVAAIAHWLVSGMTWPAAFTLGAIISPPDAVAATAIASRLGIPRRIITILEGESLVNDATGLALFKVAVAAAVTGQFSIGHAGWLFLLATVGGIGIGLVIGLIVVRIHRFLDDPVIETVVTLLTPFACFIAAESIGGSGVLAVVTTGLYVSRRSNEAFSSSLRLQAVSTWNTVTFMLNGLIFVLIGLQLNQITGTFAHGIMGPLADAVLVTVATVLVRLIWVFPASYLPRLLIPAVRRRDPYPSWKLVFIVGYTGMRGVTSLAAALAVPEFTTSGAPFPGRETIQFLSFAIIFATLVPQSLSLPGLIRMLGIRDDADTGCEEQEARLRAARVAAARIEALAADPNVDQPAIAGLRRQYAERIRRLSAVKESDGAGVPVEAPALGVRREVLAAERRAVIELRDQEIINDEVLHRIERDLDLEELRLRPQA